MDQKVDCRQSARDRSVERHWRIALILLALVAIAVRMPMIGHPALDVDEEFYLLVGDRMLHGALPYVDIWDRKPLGLFLLYAGMHALGGNGVIAYQIVAALTVAATSVLIAIIARRIATPGAGIAAALCYSPSLLMIGGQGGQTPVYYNLLVLVAVWLLLPGQGKTKPDRAFTRGLGAMALIGLALQIKYTVLFEGLYLGLVLLRRDHTARLPIAARVGRTLVWICAALMPTLAAWASYAALGHNQDFVFANFVSILGRHGIGAHDAWDNLRDAMRQLIPFFLTLLIGEWLLRNQVPWWRDVERRADHRFLIGWLGAAGGGYVIFGSYFAHYALPLLPPLTIFMAPAFSIRVRRIGVGLATAAILYMFLTTPGRIRKLFARQGSAAYTYALADRIRPLLKGRCLYIFDGQPALYQLTGSCLPSRWAFPYHISLTRESAALGVDPHAEFERIIAARPPVIIDRISEDESIDRPLQAELRSRLAGDYRLIYRFTHHSQHDDTDMIWTLRSHR